MTCGRAPGPFQSLMLTEWAEDQHEEVGSRSVSQSGGFAVNPCQGNE